MSAGIPAPWSKHRLAAETIGQAVADAVTNATGGNIDLGVTSPCDPEEMLTGRPLPLHAIVVRFGRPLRDVMIFVSSLKEDAVRPLVEVAARAALASLDVPTGDDAHGTIGSFVIEDAVEYHDLDDALEQCDALYLEAAYSLELPTGELQMVLGTGLLEAATSFVAGTVDTLDDAPSVALADDQGVEEIVDDAALAPGERVDAEVPAHATTSGLESFDAMLAEQEHAEAATVAAKAAAPAAAAEDARSMHEATASRWTELLSGVEVELSAELGRTHLPLRDITSLNSASVLTLDQLVHEPVTVYVNGTRYATARLVVVDSEYGIEIVEVVDQTTLASTLAA